MRLLLMTIKIVAKEDVELTNVDRIYIINELNRWLDWMPCQNKVEREK